MDNVKIKPIEWKSIDDSTFRGGTPLGWFQIDYSWWDGESANWSFYTNINAIETDDFRTCKATAKEMQDYCQQVYEELIKKCLM
jgi:hypothetical protein